MSTRAAATASDSELARLVGLIRSASSVVALTGAGISVPSGIPDFRSPGTGLWERVDPMEVAHIDAFRSDPARFWQFYGERFATLGAKRPNAAHHALVAMQRSGHLDAVITQNVDLLHRKAGTRDLIEVHGSIATCSCPACLSSETLERAQQLIRSSDDRVPRCAGCGAALKPDVVLFGELLPGAALERARALCTGAEVLLCIGSSLEVHPVAALPALTLASGGSVAIITRGETPFDASATLRFDGDVVEELERLLAALDS